MTRVIRWEFIGVDKEGNTCTGHKFCSRGEEEITAWAKEHGIEKLYCGYAGLVPDDFVLDFDIVEEIFNRIPEHTRIQVLHALNRFVKRQLEEENE